MKVAVTPYVVCSHAVIALTSLWYHDLAAVSLCIGWIAFVSIIELELQKKLPHLTKKTENGSVPIWLPDYILCMIGCLIVLMFAVTIVATWCHNVTWIVAGICQLLLVLLYACKTQK